MPTTPSFSNATSGTQTSINVKGYPELNLLETAPTLDAEDGTVTVGTQDLHQRYHKDASGRVWGTYERTRPGPNPSGTHGAFTHLFVEDDEGLKYVLLASERPNPAAHATEGSEDGTSFTKWVLELPGTMNKRVKPDGPYIDTIPYALSTKLGLWYNADGSLNTTLADAGPGLTSPGTMDEQKNFSVSFVTFSGKLNIDGSNLPPTYDWYTGKPIDHTEGGFRIFPIVVRTEDVSKLVEEFSKQSNCAVDAPVAASHLFTSRFGKALVDSLRAEQEQTESDTVKSE